MNIDSETFFILDMLGYLGYTLLMIGMILIAKGKKIGWQVRAAGEMLWVAISFHLGLTSGVIFGVLFLCIDIFGAIPPEISKPAATE